MRRSSNVRLAQLNECLASSLMTNCGVRVFSAAENRDTRRHHNKHNNRHRNKHHNKRHNKQRVRLRRPWSLLGRAPLSGPHRFV